MPVPVVLAALGAVPAAAVATAWYVKRGFARKLAKTRVAILGNRRVGKSALLDALQKPSHDRALPATAAPLGGSFEMEISGKVVRFEVPRDLPGNQRLALQAWKEAFEEAGNIWYLFRADRVVQGDLDEISIIRKHIALLAGWMQQGHKPKVVLVGTWAEQDDEWASNREQFIERVSRADPINVALVKLNFASLVVGSLGTPKDAIALVRDLRKQYR